MPIVHYPEIVFQPHPAHYRFHDLTNTVHGRLTVLGYAGLYPVRTSWYCLCECGTLVRVIGDKLIRRTTLSCGCYNLASRLARLTTHGMSGTPIYVTWLQMRARCRNNSRPDFKNYGGRGIGVCEEWLQFENFYADMGERPGPAYSLERIDNDKGYSKENCKWASRQEQNRNKRSNINVEYHGRTQLLIEWAFELGFRYKLLHHRIFTLGWGIDKAFTTPLISPHAPRRNR